MTIIYTLIGVSLALPLLFSGSNTSESTLIAKSQPKNCARSVTEDEEF